MTSPLEIVQLARSLVALGISVEEYRHISANPDMSDEELAAHIDLNIAELEALRDKEH